jgi:hypothetical protein
MNSLMPLSPSNKKAMDGNNEHYNADESAHQFGQTPHSLKKLLCCVMIEFMQDGCSFVKAPGAARHRHGAENLIPLCEQ